MLAERRDWFGSTSGLGGKRRFDGMLGEGVSAKSPTSRKEREKWGTRRYFAVPALLRRPKTLFEILYLGVQAFGKMGAEAGEVFFDQRDLGLPASDVDA